MSIELILSEIREIKGILADLTPSTSPWIKGDLNAAKWCDYKTSRPFLAEMRRIGVKPSKGDGCNFWKKQDITRAREKAQR